MLTINCVLQFASWLSECTLHGAWCGYCGMDKNNMASVGHSWWFGPILLGAQSKHSASDNQLMAMKIEEDNITKIH